MTIQVVYNGVKSRNNIAALPGCRISGSRFVLTLVRMSWLLLIFTIFLLIYFPGFCLLKEKLPDLGNRISADLQLLPEENFLAGKELETTTSFKHDLRFHCLCPPRVTVVDLKTSSFVLSLLDFRLKHHH